MGDDHCLTMSIVKPEPSDLDRLYRRYLACLNRRDWEGLGAFVAEDVRHNDRALGLAGYRAMLERDCRDIPDLRFAVGTLVCARSDIAARLLFDCTPVGSFLGLPVNGRRVRFAENVFYRVADDRIAEVWSVIDRAAIEVQLAEAGRPSSATSPASDQAE